MSCPVFFHQTFIVTEWHWMMACCGFFQRVNLWSLAILGQTRQHLDVNGMDTCFLGLFGNCSATKNACFSRLQWRVYVNREALFQLIWLPLRKHSYTIHVRYIYLHLPYFTIKNHQNVGKYTIHWMLWDSPKAGYSKGEPSFPTNFCFLRWLTQVSRDSQAVLSNMQVRCGKQAIFRSPKRMTLGKHTSLLSKGIPGGDPKDRKRKNPCFFLGGGRLFFPWEFFESPEWFH